MIREYVKPEIQLVHLKAEEAVLTACKQWASGGSGAYMTGGGTGWGDPGNCQKIDGLATRCNILGS